MFLACALEVELVASFMTHIYIHINLIIKSHFSFLSLEYYYIYCVGNSADLGIGSFTVFGLSPENTVETCYVCLFYWINDIFQSSSFVQNTDRRSERYIIYHQYLNFFSKFFYNIVLGGGHMFTRVPASSSKRIETCKRMEKLCN